jgi:hypothetical protein
MLPIVEIMKILKNNQHQIYIKYMDVECDLMIQNTQRHVAFI